MAASFLRVPPFPGHRAGPLAVAAPGNGEDVDALIAALADARVGGSFWAAQPDLPPGRDVVLAPDTQAQAWDMLGAAMAQGKAARAVMIGAFASRRSATSQPVPVITRLCDPWHLAGQAGEICAGPNNELALVAALLGRPLTVIGTGRFSRLDGSIAGLRAVVAAELLGGGWRDPFTGEQVSARDIVALLADWRALIDANRGIAAVLGVARWKRSTMDALLWDGSGPVRHAGVRTAASLPADARALAWKTRTAPALLDGLAARGIAVGEIEDGMIRSTGLGANCVPPLSVIIDPLAAHFDPSRPSTLENLLQHGQFPPELVARAHSLRARLVAAGISKYGQGAGMDKRPPVFAGPGRCRRVLVTGQVEDDRAVLLGGAGCSNRDLLARAREIEPDAEIIYKPHPDVEAGHRRGAIPNSEVLAFADRIERYSAISTLLDEVDGLHVISSLAGFEALCRGVAVTTHGVPFYAGWGLTRDLGPIPPRRQRRRTLDELIAAVLILYPRYLDPVTRLPCAVEVLVERMAAGQAHVGSPLAALRQWQGRAKLWFGK